MQNNHTAFNYWKLAIAFFIALIVVVVFGCKGKDGGDKKAVIDTLEGSTSGRISVDHPLGVGGGWRLPDSAVVTQPKLTIDTAYIKPKKRRGIF
jgi:hypothetical protein